MKAPKVHDGKKLVCEDVYRERFPTTKGVAEEILHAIRLKYGPEDGWVEIGAWLEKTQDGKYVAVRHHAQYK